MKIGRTKIPRLGLLAGLLLVGALTVGLAAPALAVDHPIVVYGDVELDDADAPVGTSIEIYLDSVLEETTTVTTAGEYGPVQIWANDPADHGKVFTFTVDGFPANSTPAAPEFGWENQEVDLAAWSGETYTLTVIIAPTGGGTVTGTGIACPGDCTQDYAEDTVVALTAAANAGYEWVNWTGSASGTSLAVNVTMDADKTVTANFSSVETYTLTVTINPAGGGTVTGTGIACPGDCTQDYAEDTVVALTAAANAGFEFVNWTGSASGTSLTVNVTMSADKTVTANFRVPVVPGEYVLEPGPNTLSTPAYLDSTLGDVIPGVYATDWLGYQLTWSAWTGTTWSAATASTTISPLDGFAIINLTDEDIELDVDNWPWAEWESGDSPLLPPTKQLSANQWALVGPAPGLVNGDAPDISVDGFMAGVEASRVVSPGWGDQSSWTATYIPLWGWDVQIASPYKAYFVFPTAASQLTGSCTLP